MPRRKINGDRLVNSIVHDCEHQRPQLTKKQADEIPSPDLLAAEDSARSAVVAARSLLMAEIERQEGALRSEWPLSEIWSGIRHQASAH